MADLRTELLALIEAGQPLDGDGMTEVERCVAAGWCANLTALLERCPAPAEMDEGDLQSLADKMVAALLKGPKGWSVEPWQMELGLIALSRLGIHLPTALLRPTEPPTEPGRYYARSKREPGGQAEELEVVRIWEDRPGVVFSAGLEIEQRLSDYDWFGPVPMPEVAG